MAVESHTHRRVQLPMEQVLDPVQPLQVSKYMYTAAVGYMVWVEQKCDIFL